ncbi:MAG TPA: tetratricopeptide repeat protein [Chitinophagaceae bacterium]|nr:tetratricopeptide repeat protein [Chitinophagaceae bacterium]
MSTLNKKVQDLEEELQNAKDPLLQIDLLNKEAYELRHTDIALSLQKSSIAIELSQKNAYQKGYAAALLNLGFSQMLQADYTTAFQTLYKASDIFKELEDKAGCAHAFYNIAVVYSRIGEYNQALDFIQQSIAIRQELKDEDGEAACLMQLGYINERFNNDEEADEYYTRCLAIRRKIDDQHGIAATLLGIGILKQKRGQFEEAEKYIIESMDIRKEIGETHGWLVSVSYLGEYYTTQNKYSEAEKYLVEAIELAKQQTIPFPANLCRLYISLAKVQMGYKNFEQASQYLEQALNLATENNLKYLIYDIYATLSEVYKHKGDYKNAFENFEKYHHAKEEIINLSASTKLKNLELTNQIETEKKEAEIHRLRHIELKKAYDQLQRTQEQLIQAEKLAYLGHLMAGIAHEIQNPLNFVNNFSEVSKELLDELKVEKNKERNAAEADEMYEAIKQNLDKIAYHGKRADSIVKSMLLHSRVTTNKKQLADINALADEYLRLSFEAMQSKDKTFDVQLQTSFDASIGKIYIMPQDIGRVLINLYNNAFYSMQEKKGLVKDYEPILKISTQQKDDSIEIKIRDNGNGIPNEIIDKIYQPFFTTKPTGEGTGLGLSLSYDIITKGHGGNMLVTTKEGEFTEFILRIPAS